MPNPNIKKNETEKMPAKRGRKPAVTNPELIVPAPKAKRSYNKKAVKKTNLIVRNISTDKEPVDTVTKTNAKKTMVIESKDLKKTNLKKEAKEKVMPSESFVEAETPKGRVINERSEKHRTLMMWTGVTFFMLLIFIFWAYNTKQNIERSRSDWSASEEAISWKEMSEELGSQINAIKEGVSTIQEFASSSESMEPGRNDMFQESSGTNLKPVDEELIKDLKHDLEIKAGSSEPDEKDYYFLMGQEEQASFVSSVDSIKLGMSISEVRKILGEADYSQELRDQRGVFVVNVLSYYMKIFKKDVPDARYDKYVSFEFDGSGKLLRINKQL